MACVDTGWDYRDSVTGLPCNPSGGTASQPKVIATPTTGINVYSGQTTLDKILSSVLSGLALVQGAGYVPTTAHPQSASAVTQQQDINAFQQQLALSQLAQQQTSAGGKFGDSIQKFVTENTELLLIAGVALVLFRSGRK